ncbi:hypothetical protein [Phenylobacterium sp.]|uniref:hypothetical protein n=1 Tax=Phenylobacterium sp. TaxID=1871053 RepID=UPI0025EB8E73|nr:hypothetical protein [Phenylobacterium sp.]
MRDIVTPPPAKPRTGLAVAGLICLVLGLAGFAAIAAVVYGDSALAETWAIRLGLAGGLLASATAQILILIGGWMIWRATRRTGPKGPL